MGWSSATSILDDLIESLEIAQVTEDQKFKVVKTMIVSFANDDADCLDESDFIDNLWFRKCLVAADYWQQSDVCGRCSYHLYSQEVCDNCYPNEDTDDNS